MNAIGDVPDGNGVFCLVGIETRPHGSGYLAVEGRNGVGATREFQTQHRHAELFLMIAGILAAKCHQPFMRKPQSVAEWPKVLFDQAGIEAVMTCRVPGCAW